ncbi:hypothetical protein ACJX0J_027480 [Zea mays]
MCMHIQDIIMAHYRGDGLIGTYVYKAILAITKADCLYTCLINGPQEITCIYTKHNTTLIDIFDVIPIIYVSNIDVHKHISDELHATHVLCFVKNLGAKNVF